MELISHFGRVASKDSMGLMSQFGESTERNLQLRAKQFRGIHRADQHDGVDSSLTAKSEREQFGRVGKGVTESVRHC
jgi:hypothetical protein